MKVKGKERRLVVVVVVVKEAADNTLNKHSCIHYSTQLSQTAALSILTLFRRFFLNFDDKNPIQTLTVHFLLLLKMITYFQCHHVRGKMSIRLVGRLVGLVNIIF